MTFAIVWLSLCLFMYANAFGQWWLFSMGVFGAFAAICLGHVGRFVMFILEAIREAFSEPETTGEPHTVDSVRAAALKVHNWVSRHTAAAIAIVCMLLIYFTHSLFVLIVGLIAVPMATSWPAVMKQLRKWATPVPEAAE